jgi:hypothetical protein
MSTEIWIDPNDKTKRYEIGTEGWEFNDSGRPNNILDDARDSILAAVLLLEQACCLLRNISVQATSLNQRKGRVRGILFNESRSALRLG